MPELWNLALLALPAGLLGFAAAPCCGLLAPAYVPVALGTATGVAAGATVGRRRVLATSLSFMVGFAVVFTALGATASLVGSVLLQHLEILLQVAGVYVAGMGALMSWRGWSGRGGESCPTGRLGSGNTANLGLGVSFAIAWAPCMGPTLGVILAMAASTQRAAQGAFLLFVYALGLALPFLLMSLGLARGGSTQALLLRHQARVQQWGGALLIGLGALIALGGWKGMLAPVTQWLSERGWPPI